MINLIVPNCLLFFHSPFLSSLSYFTCTFLSLPLYLSFDVYYLTSRSSMGLHQYRFKLGWPTKRVNIFRHESSPFTKLELDIILKGKRCLTILINSCWFLPTLSIIYKITQFFLILLLDSLIYQKNGYSKHQLQ